MPGARSPRAAADPSPASSGGAGGGEVRSVGRALRLLGLIETAGSHATLTALSRASALPTSTVLRLLHTLEAERFVVRTPDGHWALGPALALLGLAATRSMPLHERAGPALVRLSATTGETASLAVSDGPGRAVYLRQCVSAQALRHESWLGRSFDCRRTATGRALAGRVDADGGHATRRTRTPDVSAVSSPVHGPDGAILGALTVSGPSVRIDDAALERLRRHAIESARALSLELGGGWPHAAPAGRLPGAPRRRAG